MPLASVELLSAPCSFISSDASWMSVMSSETGSGPVRLLTVMVVSLPVSPARSRMSCRRSTSLLTSPSRSTGSSGNAANARSLMSFSVMSSSLAALALSCASSMSPNTFADCGFIFSSRSDSHSSAFSPKRSPLSLPIARVISAPPASTRCGLPSTETTLSIARPATSQFASHASIAKPSCSIFLYAGLSSMFGRSCCASGSHGDTVTRFPASSLPKNVSAPSTPALRYSADASTSLPACRGLFATLT